MELRRYLRVLRRGCSIVVLCTLGGVVLAGVYLSVTPKTFTATTSLLVAISRTGSAEDSAGAPPSSPTPP